MTEYRIRVDRDKSTTIMTTLGETAKFTSPYHAMLFLEQMYNRGDAISVIEIVSDLELAEVEFEVVVTSLLYNLSPEIISDNIKVKVMHYDLYKKFARIIRKR